MSTLLHDLFQKTLASFVSVIIRYYLYMACHLCYKSKVLLHHRVETEGCQTRTTSAMTSFIDVNATVSSSQEGHGLTSPHLFVRPSEEMILDS